jgi:hypothetical protein
MSAEHDPPSLAAPERARLDGWKDIASYFGRGVRTVQRWETELHLPVRRIDTGRGQVTYAFVDELERWRESARARNATSEAATGADDNGASWPGGDARDGEAPRDGAQCAPGNGHPAAPAAVAGTASNRIRLIAGVGAGAVAVAVVAILGWRWFAVPAHPGGPASASVSGGALKAFDAAGTLLWTHWFEFPLTASVYVDLLPGYDRPPIVVADVDGDGTREVLFVAEPWLPEGRGLFCFNADGSLRFHHLPGRVVKFGAKSYAPPWRGVSVYVMGPAGGPRDIWFVSTHLEEYPTLLERLDGSGNGRGEYWNDGQIALVRAAEVGGRWLVFVGAINNEFKGATLAVLDAQHPSGSAPAASAEYRCDGCPPGSPLAFLVFPRLDVTAAIGTHPRVGNVFVDRLGQVLVDVVHDVGDGVPPELRSNALTHYRLDRHYRVIAAELGERLPTVHALFERKGLLDHPFSRERDAQFLWPVRRWDGSKFVEITRPETPGRN